MDKKDILEEVGIDLIKTSNVLVEGLQELLISQSQGFNHILANLDTSEVYTKEEFLDTTSQITHMLDSISNFEDTISQKLILGQKLINIEE